ncbi:MAG TPA: zinc ribbon domain-containing protein, partial [Thermoplasmata archaeon]|nr:zinc ribbon domain-containing protein [Thermoplasmata archaeon]
MESTVPCPMCDAPVAVNATLCPSCGVKFAPARKLEDELEDLGNAAVQDMVSEGLAGEASPPIPPKPEGKARPPTAPEGPAAPKPLSKKGLTNGLVLSRGAGRRTGMTNGLKGRTNGLRGRTNGLTNGLGRTNGLTNGLGRTNGLTNGLGRTNGLTNGLGRTNGLTNGLGRTNGLTNGLGGRRLSGFRAIGFRSMMETAGWKLYVIPLIVVGLLLVPLFTVPEYSGRSSPIQIDGQFGDWAGVATEAMTSGGVPDPNIDVVRFGVMPNLGPVAFYVELAGSALAGGGPAPGTMDSVRIFVDIDGSASTGYRIDGLGADRMIEVSGHNGTVLSSTLSEFDSNRDSKDWNGWIKATATPAAASGSRIEAEAEWIAGSSTSAPIVATVHTASWDGQADAGDFPVSPGLGTLSVTADPQVPNILAGNGVALLRLTLTAHVLPVTLGSLHVEVAGTAPASAATSVRLMDGANVLAQVVPTSRDVTFSFPPIQIAPGAPTTLLVAGDFVSSTGETYGIRLPSSHPFGLGAGVISLRENPGARSLGYLGFVPSGPRVDGAFDEWTALSSDGMGDVGPRNNPDIDLRAYGAQRAGGSTFLYTDVTGRIFHGTPTPELPKQAPPQAQGAADTDRDGVPDPLDPFPLDFNNDGIPDARTNGDYDGDGVTDYGFPGGTDYWLNTTIPATFPAPYAGRVVSVYIGPDNRPPALGEDVIRIFLDLDNSSFSGYSIGGIGADRLVELRGKDGTVTQSALLGFSGSFPGEWAWTPLTPVTVALGYHAVELSVPLNASNMYVESGDFWGSVDSTTVIRAFAPLTSSFKVSSASAPLAVPWQQAGPQTTATQIDPNSNAATTRYNQQRKVVRAGTGAGATPCDAANSAGCWYAIFYDQVFDNPPPTTDSFLPTANVGTTDNCGGPDAGDWVTPNNAHSDTDSSASATAAPNPKNKVFCTKWKAFGFSIPTDATISAVKVQFRYHQGGTDSGYNLNIGPRSLGGGAPFVCPVQVESTHSGTFATYLFDFTSACSGHSWVPADFNSNGIEVDIGADRGNTNTAQTLSLDWVKVQVTYAIIHTWDRVVLTRSRDTSGSTWSPTPVVLASGRASDTPLLYSYDSTDPSIAMDSLGYLHVVWVSAATTGDQTVLNLVRYTKTTVPYPTEAQLASSANWAAVTNVDDASPGYMPTISTDTSNNPHIAWSQSKAFENVATIDYRSNTGTNTVNSPKSRTWDGTSWSASETEEATAGSPLRNVRMAYSPIASNERIVVSVSDDGWLDAYVCTPTCTVTNNLGQVWSTAPVSPDYRFDIAYEQLSGTAILVYGVLSTDTTRDIAYREYTGSWGPEQYVDNTINATDLQYSVLHLAPRAGSDQIGLIGATTNNVVDAWIWSGTAFGSLTEMTPTGYNADYLRDHLAIAWETNSGNLMAVTIPSGGQSVLYKRFTTSWSSASTFTCSAAGKSIEFMSLKPNPASTANDMILAAEDVGSGFSSVNTCYWDGSGWSNLVTHDSATDSWISRAMDFAWEATGSKGLLVWGTTSGQITYRTFSAPNTWGSITNVAMGTSTHLWVTLQTNPNPQPGATRILGVVMEGTGINLGAITWDGGTFSVVGAS